MLTSERLVVKSVVFNWKGWWVVIAADFQGNKQCYFSLCSPVIWISQGYLLFSQTLWCMQISVTSWWVTARANAGENSWVMSLSPMRIDLKLERCSVTEAGLSSSHGDSESPGQIVFIIIFFNCVLGGLMHELLWPSELFCSLLDKCCWMCSHADSRYSCPLIIVDGAAWLMGSLKQFRNKKRCCSLLDLINSLLWSSWKDWEGVQVEEHLLLWALPKASLAWPWSESLGLTWRLDHCSLPKLRCGAVCAI